MPTRSVLFFLLESVQSIPLGQNVHPWVFLGWEKEHRSAPYQRKGPLLRTSAPTAPCRGAVSSPRTELPPRLHCVLGYPSLAPRWRPAGMPEAGGARPSLPPTPPPQKPSWRKWPVGWAPPSVLPDWTGSPSVPNSHDLTRPSSLKPHLSSSLDPLP